MRIVIHGREPVVALPVGQDAPIGVVAVDVADERVGVENGNPGEFAGSALDFSYRHSAYTDQKLVITGLTFQLEKGDYSVIKAQMEDYLGRRKARQPLEYPSAGSVFKRPKGYFAGQLIEECGLKGKTVGGAQVSEKHAGFIVNTGGATCKDVQSLVKMIQETVRREKQVELECEIKLMT